MLSFAKKSLSFHRLACELHLGVENGGGGGGEPSFVDSTWEAVDLFLKNEGGSPVVTEAGGGGGGGDASSGGGGGGGGGRLYLWIGRDFSVHAALDRLPKSMAAAPSSSGVLMICHNQPTGEAVASRRQMQCLTLTTSSAAASDQDEKSVESADEKDASASSSSSSSPTAVLQALQLYTRSFLPTIQSVVDEENAGLLGDKIRQLDVALQQTTRSTRLPHVELAVHPDLKPAAARRQNSVGQAVDWEELGLASKLQDDGFLNTLQTGVSQWIVQIRTITVLPKTTPLVVEPPSESAAAAEEVAFWTQLHSELLSIQQQLKSDPGVDLTASMLREAKRFVATLALENNTGLEQAITVTTDVNSFIKSFPLQDLQAARDFDKIASSMNAIFDHLPKIRSSRYYGLDRSCTLLEATTAVLRDSLLATLQEQHSGSSNLLFLDHKDFQNKIQFPIEDVFAQFKDRYDEWSHFILDQGKRRKQDLKKVLGNMKLYHTSLEERIQLLADFRKSQEELRQIVHTVLRQDDPSSIQAVEQAPRQIFATLQVLDLSSGGKQALESAMEEYDVQMDALEERLARLLVDKLEACQVRDRAFYW